MKQFSKDLGNVSLAPKGRWSKEQEYERLALVYNACDNLSYVAKIDVPSGVDIENREYWQPMNATGYADNNFINLTAENENGTVTAYESLEEAVATILPINRRPGTTLSFYNLNSDRLDRQAEFELWQFNSTDLANWENKDYWNNIYYNWNVFAGWYIGADALKNHVKIPNVGQYAYVGTNLNDALLYQCRTNGVWTNTGIKVRNYISVVVGGNITIGENGNWFSDGKDTSIPATPAVDEQLDNIIMQLQQHATEIDKLQKQDVTLKSNIDSNFETINNKIDNIKTATDNKIDIADANLQNQITSNDTDIATLNTKHESLSRTVQGIAVTGGASTATNVTYDKTNSGLNAENAQDAIDKLANSENIKYNNDTSGLKARNMQEAIDDVDNKIRESQLYSQDISLDVFGFDKLEKFNGTITGTGWEINAGQHVQIPIRKGDVVKVNGTANGCYLAVLNKYGQPTTSNISYAKDEERRICPAWGEISFTISSDDAKCLAVELNRDDTSTKPAGISINGKNLYIPLNASVDRKSMIGQICPPFDEGSYINITPTTVFIPENTRINCAGKYFSLSETTLNREKGAQSEIVYFDIESKTLKITSIASYVQSTSNYSLFVVSYDENKICSLPVTFYTYNGKLFEDRLMDKVQLYSQDISLDVFGFDKLEKFNGTITGTGWEINAGQHVQIPIRKGDVVKVNGTANGCYLAVLNKYGQPTTSNISYAKDEERRICPAWGEISFTISSDDAKCLAVELNRDDTSTKPAGISINGKNLYIPLNASVDRKSMIGQICPPFDEGSYINITPTTVFIPENTRINCAGKYFSLSETTLNREKGAQSEIVYFDIESKTLKITSIASYVQSTSNYSLFVVSYDENKICSLPVTFYTYNGKLFEDRLMDKVQLYSQDISLDVFGFDKLEKFNGTITGTGWEINAGQHVQIPIRKGDVVKVNGTANGCYLAVLNKYGQPTTSNISYAKDEERRICPAWGEISFTISSDDAKCLAVELNRDDTSTKPAGISINGKNLYIPLNASVDRKSMIGQICPPFDEGSYINITPTTVFIPENTRINCAGKYFSLSETTLNREEGAQSEIVYFDIESKTLKITSIASYVQSTSNYSLFVVSYDENKICSLPVTFYTYNGKLFEDRLMDKVKTGFTSMFSVSSKLVNQCYYNKEKILSLLWISDLHGDENALKYAVRFKNEFNDFLDDCIHTGDSVSGTISDANPFENVLGANSFLNVIGNHEAWLSTSDNDYYATEKQTYDKIFKNNIDNWFVTQPSNAAENGKCYYYKDYPNKGYRLIVLDSVHWKVHNDDVTSNALQKEWLEQTLTDAIANSLAVIIATHYPPVNGITFSKGAKGFNSLKYSEQESAVISDGWFSAEEMFSCVDKFIDNGGKFISWIIGHEHSDYIGAVTSHTRQAVILMERSGVNSTSYSNIHLANSHSQIAFNVITFDEENNLLKITRVGNNTDIWLQSKNSICYNYNTHKVIACE